MVGKKPGKGESFTISGRNGRDPGMNANCRSGRQRCSLKSNIGLARFLKPEQIDSVFQRNGHDSR
jgi:hypothetical protein